MIDDRNRSFLRGDELVVDEKAVTLNYLWETSRWELTCWLSIPLHVCDMNWKRKYKPETRGGC
jgi:hypothetical protein